MNKKNKRKKKDIIRDTRDRDIWDPQDRQERLPPEKLPGEPKPPSKDPVHVEE